MMSVAVAAAGRGIVTMRRAPKQSSAVERKLRNQLAATFHDTAQARPWCHVCGAQRWSWSRLHAHHWLEHNMLVRELRNVVDPLRMIAIEYDLRNVSGLCETCHANHHAGIKSPLRSAHVPESAWEFARELDQFTGTEKFTVRLERY